MTYQDFGRFMRKAASAAVDVLFAVGRGIHGVRLYEALAQLSDRDLATLGITRNGIARYVAERMDPRTYRQAEQADNVHAFAKASEGPRPAAEVTDRRRAA